MSLSAHVHAAKLDRELASGVADGTGPLYAPAAANALATALGGIRGRLLAPV